MRTRMDPKRSCQVLVTWSREWLRQDVREHDGSLAVLQLDFAALDFITDVMVLDVDVLGSTVVHRVLRHLDARLVVFENLQPRRLFVRRR